MVDVTRGSRGSFGGRAGTTRSFGGRGGETGSAKNPRRKTAQRGFYRGKYNRCLRIAQQAVRYGVTKPRSCPKSAFYEAPKAGTPAGRRQASNVGREGPRVPHRARMKEARITTPKGQLKLEKKTATLAASPHEIKPPGQIFKPKDIKSRARRVGRREPGKRNFLQI